jgi:carbon-monoxide dehydrogenase large subunit
MNDMTPTSAERAEKLQGMGCKRMRVVDFRFVQGKGS